MPMNPVTVLTTVMFGAGIMALLAISYGVIERSRIRPFWRSIFHGMFFGAGAILVMLKPIQLGEGVIIDARAIIVGIAAAFGGWPAAILSGIIAGAYRAYHGGTGAPSGVIGIFMAAGLGWYWSWRLKPNGEINIRDTATLGAILALYTISAALLPKEVFFQAVTTVVPVIVAGCIFGAIAMGSLMERERRYIYSERNWRESALTDPLTDLPNRRGFFEKVNRALSAPNHGRTDALLILDADHFKRINDTHGHPVGDAALVLIAEKLKLILDEEASICRLGGEEFAVFLPATSQPAANQIAETLRLGIRKAGFTHDGVTVPLSVSIGAVMRSAASRAPLISLLRSADNALYYAKEGGRNKVVFAEPLES
ncbi:GGDEF domain-containing protein [Pseudorhodobacter turbinis]|nr:diguanylate cyclase [Pseudorhodobacter turbinis]